MEFDCAGNPRKCATDLAFCATDPHNCAGNPRRCATNPTKVRPKGSLTAPPPYSRPAPSLKKGNLDVLRKEGPCCVSNWEVFPVQ